MSSNAVPRAEAGDAEHLEAEARSPLFVPEKAALDLLLDTHKKGIRLYAKRLFVMDGCEKLAPPHLRFLEGVVDSEDLSLNISREMLRPRATVS